MKTLEDLVLVKDTSIDGDLTCGNIRCEGGRWDLTVHGNIDALDIYAWNINALDIDARDINARDIDAGDINARNINACDINALDIVCVSREKKTENAKTIAYSIVLDRWNRERTEVMPIKKEKVTK